MIMIAAPTSRSLFNATAITALAAPLFTLAVTFSPVAHAGPVNGRNVNVVESPQATFGQIGQKNWVEENKQGKRIFSFAETNRDDWSVYLRDRSRNVRLQLDIHRKKVGYSDASNPATRDLYLITSASSKLSGWLVKKVEFNNGAFVDQGGKRWVEIGSQNEVRYNFNEMARDDWSVYLKDPSRNGHIQLDLHTQRIMYNVGNDPRVPLYSISRAQ